MPEITPLPDSDEEADKKSAMSVMSEENMPLFATESLEMNPEVQRILLCEAVFAAATNELVQVFCKTITLHRDLQGSTSRAKTENLRDQAEGALLNAICNLRSHSTPWTAIYEWKSNFKPYMQKTWVDWIEIAHFQENPAHWATFWENSRPTPTTLQMCVFDDLLDPIETVSYTHLTLPTILRV